eukprot:jgi/Mesvir1/13488/Mv16537-RA.1
MYIEEISIEGFKSYAQRTVVSNFDPLFNAITGLNGSGKSNILDAICFVLGITNLSQVRASNLQELVYKQGQAGINKATVSIVFNNSDRATSPVGYEHCEQITVTRQIVIGGRNKYLINGHVAQPSRVQNLFHSVQLNVNNPHFLIMQGRITKVLNMKPLETLSMLEEAAGTRMYEMKKEGAIKTMEKKQAKLDEINQLLDVDILPAMESLRKERGEFLQWQANQKDVESLKRFCLAYEFMMAETIQGQSEEQTAKLQEQLRVMDAEVAAAEGERQQLEESAARLVAEKESAVGPEARGLGVKVDELSKVLVKETSVLRNCKDSLASDTRALVKLKDSGKELDASLQKKRAELANAEQGMGSGRARVEQLEKELVKCERDNEAIQAGKQGGEEGEKSLGEQLSDARAGMAAAQGDQQRWALQRSHAAKELAAKRAQAAAKEKEAGAAEQEVRKLQGEVDAATAALGALAFDPAHYAQLEQERVAEAALVRGAQDRFDKLSAEFPRGLHFQYSDPYPGFDRARVKGLVASLITVKDPATSTALEVTAGGRLYNVVVDSDQTGKDLLQKGKLKSRVTIIPLNKISANSVPADKMQAAHQLVGPERAKLALSLVGYDAEIKKAMEFVFGSTIVCQDSDTARKVAFDRNVMAHCVTLDGDLFNPQGTLTGGSRSQQSSVLALLHELNEAEATLRHHQARLDAIVKQLAGLTKGEKEFKKLSSAVELARHRLDLLTQRLQQGEHHQLREAIAALEASLQEATDKGAEAVARCEQLKGDAARIEASMANYAAEREKRLEQAAAKAKAARVALKEAKESIKAAESGAQKLALEVEVLQAERAGLDESVAAAEAALAKLAEEERALTEKVTATSVAYDSAKAELDAVTARLKECDAEVAALTKAKGKLGKRITDLNLDAKKVEHKLKKMEADQRQSSLVVARLLEEHPWIPSERPLFGKPGSDYDFNARSPEESRAQLEEATKQQESLSKRVNKRVMSMFDKAEQEAQDLMAKKNTVLRDKRKIEEVINELDEKKREALQRTWEKVNRDFGSIFSTLLPGTSAKLEPEAGKSFLDGLEVKVAFGTVWKQSLTELSGGQRSLLALSLILALLLFKPAPLYILDEVDAALDLSHTQNIGRMIKAHFPFSQFVVVSLKEGMFNNANVIYRTKFIDGISTVTRTVPSAKDKDKQPAVSKVARQHASQKENQVPLN